MREPVHAACLWPFLVSDGVRPCEKGASNLRNRAFVMRHKWRRKLVHLINHAFLLFVYFGVDDPGLEPKRPSYSRRDRARGEEFIVLLSRSGVSTSVRNRFNFMPFPRPSFTMSIRRPSCFSSFGTISFPSSHLRTMRVCLPIRLATRTAPLPSKVPDCRVQTKLF